MPATYPAHAHPYPRLPIVQVRESGVVARHAPPPTTAPGAKRAKTAYTYTRVAEVPPQRGVIKEVREGTRPSHTHMRQIHS